MVKLVILAKEAAFLRLCLYSPFQVWINLVAITYLVYKFRGGGFRSSIGTHKVLSANVSFPCILVPPSEDVRDGCVMTDCRSCKMRNT